MRREPEYSAGEAEERRQGAERLAHRKELLAELLESAGWRQVLQPLLRLRMERIATTLAADTSRSLEEIRGLQGTYRALAAVVNTKTSDLQAEE